MLPTPADFDEIAPAQAFQLNMSNIGVYESFLFLDFFSDGCGVRTDSSTEQFFSASQA
jgi:hypothetical protein